jgi:chemotaxis protein MotA
MFGQRSSEFGTVFGLVAAFGAVAVAIALGGSPKAFLDLPAFLIVVVGTIAVTAVGFPLADVGRAFAAGFRTVGARRAAPGVAAIVILKLAEKARRDGVLSLQSQVRQFAEEPFLARGLTMIIDGMSADEADTVLRREIAATAQRNQRAAQVLRRAAEVSPAMGLIGTLIGLVQMLGNLSDPTALGPAMAVALLTTLYGAILANMILAPLAAKLERSSGEETLLNTLFLTGVTALGRQENPRRLETLLNSLLPPAQRTQLYG